MPAIEPSVDLNKILALLGFLLTAGTVVFVAGRAIGAIDAVKKRVEDFLAEHAKQHEMLESRFTTVRDVANSASSAVQRVESEQKADHRTLRKVERRVDQHDASMRAKGFTLPPASDFEE